MRARALFPDLGRRVHRSSKFRSKLGNAPTIFGCVRSVAGGDARRSGAIGIARVVGAGLEVASAASSAALQKQVPGESVPNALLGGTYHDRSPGRRWIQGRREHAGRLDASVVGQNARTGGWIGMDPCIGFLVSRSAVAFRASRRGRQCNRWVLLV